MGVVLLDERDQSGHVLAESMGEFDGPWGRRGVEGVSSVMHAAVL